MQSLQSTLSRTDHNNNDGNQDHDIYVNRHTFNFVELAEHNNSHIAYFNSLLNGHDHGRQLTVTNDLILDISNMVDAKFDSDYSISVFNSFTGDNRGHEYSCINNHHRWLTNNDRNPTICW